MHSTLSNKEIVVEALQMLMESQLLNLWRGIQAPATPALAFGLMRMPVSLSLVMNRPILLP